MRLFGLVIVLVSAVMAISGTALAQQSCKVSADQQKACMKNYAGPACSTEYKMCMKSCKK
jgi:uncharacterized protein YdeI (BOF family)